MDSEQAKLVRLFVSTLRDREITDSEWESTKYEKQSSNEWATAYRAAVSVRAALLTAAKGHEIGQNEEGYFARPITRRKSIGLGKELRDLASAAKKAVKGKISEAEWATVWAKQSRAVRRICRPFLLKPASRSIDPSKLAHSFSVPSSGFVTVVPKPDAILPGLEGEIAARGAMANENRARKPDREAFDVVVVVLEAYETLTGKRATRDDAYHDRPSAALEFARSIDKIFGTAFFLATDSDRFSQAIRVVRRSTPK